MKFGIRSKRSSKRSSKRTQRRSRKYTRKTFFNKFFDKIFVISLYDNFNKWTKVKKQFNKENIKVERFVAVDGRCKKEGFEACMDKKISFEIAYDVVIKNKEQELPVLIPASSLTIGTLTLIRAQIRNKWKHMLVCEDDIVLQKKITEKFKLGVKNIPKNWDLLYLGCGQHCGSNGIGYDKTKTNKHLSTLSEIYGYDMYVQNKDDLRTVCDDGCKSVNKYLSVADEPGGTWCYAYSLKGAKKLVKLMGKNVGNHIDDIIKTNVRNGKLRAYSFDPPIVMHEEGAVRTNTDIPWEW